MKLNQKDINYFIFKFIIENMFWNIKLSHGNYIN